MDKITITHTHTHNIYIYIYLYIQLFGLFLFIFNIITRNALCPSYTITFSSQSYVRFASLYKSISSGIYEPAATEFILELQNNRVRDHNRMRLQNSFMFPATHTLVRPQIGFNSIYFKTHNIKKQAIQIQIIISHMVRMKYN